MDVFDNWWPSFSGQTLNAGVIAGVDFDIDTNNHFQLELYLEQGVYYAMRYNAVVSYAFKTHCSYSLFCLPAHALCDPVEDVVVVETVDEDDDNNDNNDFITPPSTQQKMPP